jgi:hypothetical protein
MQVFMAFSVTSTRVGDLLHWPQVTKKSIQSGRWYNPRDALQGDVLEKKASAQRKMAAYLFELVGELLLGTDNCVSENPGFESPLGWFGLRSED